MNTPQETAPPAPPSSGLRPQPPSSPATEEARERAIALLTDRYAEGAIDDVALELHFDRLFAAASVSAVDAVVAELSAAAPPPQSAPAPVVPSERVAARRRILAVMSESKRAGRWIVPPELKVVAIMSDLKLDFRNAVLPPEAVVDVTAVMASVKLTVPPGLPVIFEAAGVMSTTMSDAIEGDSRSQGPVLRVVGGALMAEVRVIVKEPKAR